MTTLAQTILSGEMLVPIGLVCVVGLAVLGGVVRATWLLGKVNQRLTRMEESQRLQWTVKDQQVWSLTLQIKNPALRVPLIDDKGRHEAPGETPSEGT